MANESDITKFETPAETEAESAGPAEEDVWVDLAATFQAPDQTPIKGPIDGKYLDASMEMYSARQAISNLPPDQRALWDDFQIKLWDVSGNPEAFQQILAMRQRAFPGIASKLEQATDLMVDAGRLSRQFNREKFTEAIENEFGRVAGRRVRQALFEAPKASIDQDRAALEVSFVRDNQGNLTPEIKGTAALPYVDLVPHTLDDSSQAASFNLDQIFNQRPKHFSEIVDRAVKNPGRITPDFYENHWRDRAVTTLRSINTPSAEDIVAIRTQRLAELLKEVTGENLAQQDMEKFLANPLATPKSKVAFLQELERLIVGTTTNRTRNIERVLLVGQLFYQAADVTRIDQGPHPTCSFSSIEKRLLARHPEILARMITDVALDGSTTTITGHKLDIDKQWLGLSEESIGYPPSNESRSLASQYAAMIIGNMRFQLFNEKFSTDLRFANFQGQDVILDMRQNPPVPIYDLNLETGELKTQPSTYQIDGKPALDLDMQPILESPLSSPRVDATTGLDTYEALTGKSGDKIGLMHYDLARIPGSAYSLTAWKNWFFQTEPVGDNRLLIFRNTDELGEHLKDTQRRGDFPLLYHIPRHLATVNNYYADRKAAEYDNQWGRTSDLIGENSMTLTAMTKLGKDGFAFADQTPDPATLQQVRIIRDAYERWCGQTGVVPDSRYPTKEELVAWVTSRRR